jgi:ABC-type multidrug transport system permease subunit
MSDFFLTILLPFLYGTCIYWCVGLRPEASAFFVFQVIFLSAILSAQSIGMLLSAAIPDFAAASSLSFVLVLLLMLFGGYYVDNSRIPPGIQWIKYLSYIYWT